MLAAAKRSLTFFVSNLAVAGLSVTLTYAALEISLRLIKGKLTSRDHVISLKINTLRSSYPVMYDEFLGWVPRPGASSGRDLWFNKRVTILANGLRSNGPDSSVKDRPPILAVGDSFTFGDEVSDDETWPAILERLSGTKVLNGGVFAYGLDQILLRAERLVGEHSPGLLIVSFVEEDILRCELSVRDSAAKPYFVAENGKLVLKNNPVPKLEPAKDHFDPFRKIFGYSYLMHFIMIRWNSQHWLFGSGSRTIIVHHQGLEVARLLLERLSEFSAKKKIKTILVIQGEKSGSPRHLEEIDSLLSSVRTDSLIILNLLAKLEEIRTNHPGRFYQMFGKSHMSPRGNEFIASEIYRLIQNDKRLLS